MLYQYNTITDNFFQYQTPQSLINAVKHRSCEATRCAQRFEESQTEFNKLKFDPKEISILDFAPKLFKYYGIKIGGRIEDFYPQSIRCNNIAFVGEIIPPRLTASNKKELYDKACKNYKNTHEILKKFSDNPTPILIINDISIYLHVGSKNFLLDTINKANTFFGNSYYGTSIKKNFAKVFSLKEKRSVEYITSKFENSYSMD